MAFENNNDTIKRVNFVDENEQTNTIKRVNFVDENEQTNVTKKIKYIDENNTEQLAWVEPHTIKVNKESNINGYNSITIYGSSSTTEIYPNVPATRLLYNSGTTATYGTVYDRNEVYYDETITIEIYRKSYYYYPEIQIVDKSLGTGTLYLVQNSQPVNMTGRISSTVDNTKITLTYKIQDDVEFTIINKPKVCSLLDGRQYDYQSNSDYLFHSCYHGSNVRYIKFYNEKQEDITSAYYGDNIYYQAIGENNYVSTDLIEVTLDETYFATQFTESGTLPTGEKKYTKIMSDTTYNMNLNVLLRDPLDNYGKAFGFNINKYTGADTIKYFIFKKPGDDDIDGLTNYVKYQNHEQLPTSWNEITNFGQNEIIVNHDSILMLYIVPETNYIVTAKGSVDPDTIASAINPIIYKCNINGTKELTFGGGFLYASPLTFSDESGGINKEYIGYPDTDKYFSDNTGDYALGNGVAAKFLLKTLDISDDGIDFIVATVKFPDPTTKHSIDRYCKYMNAEGNTYYTEGTILTGKKYYYNDFANIVLSARTKSFTKTQLSLTNQFSNAQIYSTVELSSSVQDKKNITYHRYKTLTLYALPDCKLKVYAVAKSGYVYTETSQNKPLTLTYPDNTTTFKPVCGERYKLSINSDTSQVDSIHISYLYNGKTTPTDFIEITNASYSNFLTYDLKDDSTADDDLIDKYAWYVVPKAGYSTSQAQKTSYTTSDYVCLTADTTFNVKYDGYDANDTLLTLNTTAVTIHHGTGLTAYDIEYTYHGETVSDTVSAAGSTRVINADCFSTISITPLVDGNNVNIYESSTVTVELSTEASLDMYIGDSRVSGYSGLTAKTKKFKIVDNNITDKFGNYYINTGALVSITYKDQNNTAKTISISVGESPDTNYYMTRCSDGYLAFEFNIYMDMSIVSVTIDPNNHHFDNFYTHSSEYSNDVILPATCYNNYTLNITKSSFTPKDDKAVFLFFRLYDSISNMYVLDDNKIFDESDIVRNTVTINFTSFDSNVSLGTPGSYYVPVATTSYESSLSLSVNTAKGSRAPTVSWVQLDEDTFSLCNESRAVKTDAQILHDLVENGYISHSDVISSLPTSIEIHDDVTIIFIDYTEEPTYNFYTVELKNDNTPLQCVFVRTYDTDLYDIPEYAFPQKIGHTFAGFYSKTNGQGICYIDQNGKWNTSVLTNDSTCISSHISLYAHFTPNLYTVRVYCPLELTWNTLYVKSSKASGWLTTSFQSIEDIVCRTNSGVTRTYAREYFPHSPYESGSYYGWNSNDRWPTGYDIQLPFGEKLYFYLNVNTDMASSSYNSASNAYEFTLNAVVLPNAQMYGSTGDPVSSIGLRPSIKRTTMTFKIAPHSNLTLRFVGTETYFYDGYGRDGSSFDSDYLIKIETNRNGTISTGNFAMTSFNNTCPEQTISNTGNAAIYCSCTMPYQTYMDYNITTESNNWELYSYNFIYNSNPYDYYTIPYMDTILIGAAGYRGYHNIEYYVRGKLMTATINLGNALDLNGTLGYIVSKVYYNINDDEWLNVECSDYNYDEDKHACVISLNNIRYGDHLLYYIEYNLAYAAPLTSGIPTYESQKEITSVTANINATYTFQRKTATLRLYARPGVKAIVVSPTSGNCVIEQDTEYEFKDFTYDTAHDDGTRYKDFTVRVGDRYVCYAKLFNGYTVPSSDTYEQAISYSSDKEFAIENTYYEKYVADPSPTGIPSYINIYTCDYLESGQDYITSTFQAYNSLAADSHISVVLGYEARYQSQINAVVSGSSSVFNIAPGSNRMDGYRFNGNNLNECIYWCYTNCFWIDDAWPLNLDYSAYGINNYVEPRAQVWYYSNECAANVAISTYSSTQIQVKNNTPHSITVKYRKSSSTGSYTTVSYSANSTYLIEKLSASTPYDFIVTWCKNLPHLQSYTVRNLYYYTTKSTASSGSSTGCVTDNSKILISQYGDTKLAKDIRVGDSIISYNGISYINNKITDIYRTDKTIQTYKVETDNQILYITGHHPIQTIDGYKTVEDDLLYNKLNIETDSVFTYYGYEKIKNISEYNYTGVLYNFYCENDNFISNNVLIGCENPSVNGIEYVDTCGVGLAEAIKIDKA